MIKKISKKKTIGIELTIKAIGTNIVHIIMEDKNSLARAMCRFQEYYESPFEDIRGKVFTLGYLKSKGSRSNPRINTYCGNGLMSADWAGYNFPHQAIKPFAQGLFDPLTQEEEAIVEVLKYRTDDYYVIATYGENDEAGALEHEIRHALYGICPEYRNEVNKALKRYYKKLEPLRNCLKDWGYHVDVLEDECHAYMGADHDYFFESFISDVEKYKINKVPKLRDNLNDIAKKYKKKLKIYS